MAEEFKVRSVKFNLLMNIVLKISGIIFPLITFPYISRILLSEANGKIAFATSVVGYFTLVASMGIPSYGIRKCAEVRDDRQKLSKIVTELLILNAIFTVVSYVIFVILLISVPKFTSESTLFLITSITILFNMLGVEWFYQAIEQYKYITIRNIAFKVLSIILMFGFVHQPSDYILYAGINVLASVGSNILNIIRLPQYVDLRNQKHLEYDLYIHLTPIITLFLYNATTVIFTSLDQVLLGFLKGDSSVGFYVAAIRIKLILVSFITALGAVMLPRISYILKNKNRLDFEKMITKSFNFILVSSIPIAIYFVLMAKEIIFVLAGESYAQSIPVLRLLMPSIIFIGLSSVTAWQLLIPLSKEKYTIIGAIVGVIVNVSVNIFAILKYDAIGAAIASSLAELTVLLVHIIVLKTIIRSTFEIKELMLVLLATAIAMIMTIEIKESLIIANDFVACILYGGVFFGIYAAMLLLLKEKLITEGMMLLMTRLKQRKI